MTIAPEPIWRADRQQRMFRDLLQAVSFPGRIQDLSPQLQGAPAYRGVLATLVDGAVFLSDPHRLLDDTDWPLLQARAAPPDAADYILCDGGRTVNFSPRLGDLPNPERGATLILLVECIGAGDQTVAVSGPGIDDQMVVHLAGLDRSWLTRRQGWVLNFPLGVDFILADSARVVAFPRTTRIGVC